jgi:hypothetical protein
MALMLDTTRRDRAAQGVQKAKAPGKYQGRGEDTERNALSQKHLKAAAKEIGCNCLILLACPAGIEPATLSLEG